MAQEIKSEQLAGAIEILDMVPQVGGIPSSDYLRITQKKYHLEMSLASSSLVGVVRVAGVIMDEGQEFYVDRKVFTPFVVVGKDSKTAFTSKVGEGTWTLKQGSRKAEFVLRYEEIGGYGKWLNKEMAQDFKVPEAMKKLLMAASRCASADPSFPALNCVYLDGQSVLASNMTIVFAATLKSRSSLNFPFPPAVVPLLSHKSVESIGIDGDRVIVACRYGHLAGAVSADAKKGFPVKGVYTQMEKAKTWPVLVKLPIAPLNAMIERMATYLSAMESEKTHLRIDIAKGQMAMTVKVGYGRFVERDFGKNYKNEAVLDWPLQLVRPVLAYVAENDKELTVRADEKRKTPYLLSGASVDLLVARRHG